MVEKLGCFDSDILAAMDQAISDRVHIISLSVGAMDMLLYYLYSIAVGAFGASQHGVFVSCSAGNSGPPTVVSPILLIVVELIVPLFMVDEGCKTKPGLRNIICSIRKEQKGWWKRLLKTEEKQAPYLKVDWNKWSDEDEEESRWFELIGV
ncbi:hypothetical protein G4B88_009443 [Cannabis sativa]|uniref:Peptidase S8/S53 domain-containing protein n=1 Tax=Cannabis sativa TaxID=3483 RepID=A0A7J6F7L1_CANSA|nr:hypothetical protein G4B88_009443 [Cannabis sativa]